MFDSPSHTEYTELGQPKSVGPGPGCSELTQEKEEEKVIIRLTFNTGFALTGFRTILPVFKKLTRHDPAIQSKTSTW